MKTLLTTFLAAGTLALATGCATPGYSGGPPSIRLPGEQMTGENANNIARIWYLESKMLADDVNMALLLDSPSRLTKWNVR
jgi:hypothetical protein